MIVDKYKRSITYARVSITDLCNLRCKYCIPIEGVKKKEHSQILTIEEIVTVCKTLASLGIEKQRITGGEPLLRKGIEVLIEEIGKISEIKQKHITTNATYLSKYAKLLKDNSFNGVNISIDTLNPQIYSDITRGGRVEDAIKGIESAIDVGLKVKLNAVLTKSIPLPEYDKLATFANDKKIELRLIELMPFSGVGDKYSSDNFISSSEFIKTFKLTKEKDYSIDKAKKYIFPDQRKISFISPLSDKFCKHCNRIRITPDGKVLTCLHSNYEYDFKEYLSDEEKLKEYFKEIIELKPKEHNLEEGILQKRDMCKIGG